MRSEVWHFLCETYLSLLIIFGCNRLSFNLSSINCDKTGISLVLAVQWSLQFSNVRTNLDNHLHRK